jgi:hypothetical protein
MAKSARSCDAQSAVLMLLHSQSANTVRFRLHA